MARCQEKDFTISQFVEELQSVRGLKVDRRSVWEFLHAERLSHKKKPPPHRSRIAKTLSAGVNNGGSIRDALIPSDWSLSMNVDQDQHGAASGWGPRGSRVKGKAPFVRWKTMTFIAVLRQDGIAAPCLFEVFLAWVRQSLVPTLKPGEIVIMDNLGSHRGKAVRSAIRAAGAKPLFLPKYSPDLNSIEQVFAKLKHLLRKAQARSYNAVLATIGALLKSYVPKECAMRE